MTSVKIYGNGWAAWAESVGYAPELTNKLLEINEQYIKHNPALS